MRRWAAASIEDLTPDGLGLAYHDRIGMSCVCAPTHLVGQTGEVLEHWGAMGRPLDF